MLADVVPSHHAGFVVKLDEAGMMAAAASTGQGW
jgi:hypothetical protein